MEKINQGKQTSQDEYEKDGDENENSKLRNERKIGKVHFVIFFHSLILCQNGCTKKKERRRDEFSNLITNCFKFNVIYLQTLSPAPQRRERG